VRIYLNTSALNRPPDDLSSPRVRLEADAVASILAAVQAGRVELVASEYLDFEISQTPDPERAQRVRALVGSATPRVAISPRVATRARALEKFGFRGLDALHLAAAEAAGQRCSSRRTTACSAAQAGQAPTSTCASYVQPKR
jgi:hypothetical protein